MDRNGASSAPELASDPAGATYQVLSRCRGSSPSSIRAPLATPQRGINITDFLYASGHIEVVSVPASAAWLAELTACGPNSSAFNPILSLGTLGRLGARVRHSRSNGQMYRLSGYRKKDRSTS